MIFIFNLSAGFIISSCTYLLPAALNLLWSWQVGAFQSVYMAPKIQDVDGEGLSRAKLHGAVSRALDLESFYFSTHFPE